MIGFTFMLMFILLGVGMRSGMSISTDMGSFMDSDGEASLYAKAFEEARTDNLKAQASRRLQAGTGGGVQGKGFVDYQSLQSLQLRAARQPQMHLPMRVQASPIMEASAYKPKMPAINIKPGGVNGVMPRVIGGSPPSAGVAVHAFIDR